MRKFYSLVLIATALLIGTNVKADVVNVSTAEQLVAAFTNIPEARTIQLEEDIELLANHAQSALTIAEGQNVTLALAGHNLTGYTDPVIKVNHGNLSITGPGTFTSRIDAVVLKGSTDPSAENYSVLSVASDVNIVGTNSDYILWITTNNGCAFGAKMFINGHVTSAKAGLYINGTVQKTEGNVPEIYVNEGAQVIAAANYAGIYAAGYGKWFIKGHVSGGAGIYAKAGNVVVDGGTITATAPTYTEAKPNGNGYDGGMGCAIIQDSKNGYAGGMQLTVTGNATLTSNAEGGYAIQEIKTDASQSKTENIVIKSGTFNGNINTTAELKENIVLNGSITGGTFTQDITQYLSNVTGVITPVTDENGNTTYVINEKPAEKSWLTTIVGASAADYVRMENGSPVELSADAQAKYLVMIGTAKIVVPAGKKLTVEEIVMGENAVIEVAAGGKLIVTGAQGIVSNHASNLVLKTSKTAQAIFLLNPAVTSNKHPNATVQLQTYSWYESSTSYQWQRFGIPTFGAVTSFECVENAVNTQIQAFDNGNWVSLGYIGGSPALNVADLNKPFITYNLIANRAQTDAAPVYDIKGELVGNENASLNAYSEWNLFSNSYLAKVDVEAFLTDLVGVDQVIYIATPAGVGTYTWDAKDLEWAAGVKLNPMAAFILHNPGEAAISAINYEKAVYEPATKGSSPAPRRFAQTSDKTAKLRVIVANEEGVCDDVKMTEKTSNLHNAAKYMNDDLNIYAMADEKAAIVTAEDLENTYVGFSTVKGGNFTISFANVEGREFTLVDHATGARVEIAEGNTYEFTADANSANDYRFEIVGRQNMPTAIDNTEAVKSAKGVYTITGQYVGEMSVWNTLPAGVYVVNGEKRVK